MQLLFPEMLGRCSVELFKGAEKNFIIGDSMFFHENRNGIIRALQLLIKLSYPDGIKVFQKSLPSIFLKNAAEVFPAQAEKIGGCIQGQGFPVILVDPVHDSDDP